MRRALLVLLLLVAGCTSTSAPTQAAHRPSSPATSSTDLNDGDKLTSTGCGLERWDIKTLTDPAAKSIVLKPTTSTIAALAALPAPVNPTSRTAAEQKTYTVSATVTSFKQEADSDIHLAVTDGSRTMIFEMPAAQCLSSSKTSPALVAQMNKARQTWSAKYTATPTYQSINQKVTVTGVLFFDRIHGQRGVAPNGVELHPLLSLVLG